MTFSAAAVPAIATAAATAAAELPLLPLLLLFLLLFLCPAVAPIFKASMDVFESLIMAMQQQTWGTPLAAAAAVGAGDGSGGGAAAAAAAAAGGSAVGSVMETSSYVTELANAIAVFR
jgi:hypothetical protein